MYISELGKQSGASPKAIRMYEAMGLLGTIRRQGAYRIYSDDHVRQVRLIRQAQTLGFKLAEISPLLTSDNPVPDWEQLALYLERKRVQIRSEIMRLEQLDVQLGSILAEIATCDGDLTGPDALLCETNKA
jgi:DNA-binding transcriptional MerR regulator